MSGVSPGRGHPGRGCSPSKAQASRPTLGENSQTTSNVDTSPKVSGKEQNGENGSSSIVVVMKKDEGKKVSAVKIGEVSRQQGAQVKQSAGQAAGVQLPPPAHRQRRTSLERQTLQENLQQQVLVSSMAGQGRTRSAAMPQVTKHTTATKPAVCEQGPAKATAGASNKAGKVKLQESGESTQPGTLPRPAQQVKETTRAPELQMAEEIPALVRRMGELKHHKQLLQMQIDCVYNMKTVHPDSKTLYDNKLHSLSIELAEVVKEMDCVLERMGPLAESHRNQERFLQQKQNCTSGSRSPRAQSGSVTPDEPLCVTNPILKPASFSFQKGDTQEPPHSPIAVPEHDHGAEAPQVPAETVQLDIGHPSMFQGEAAIQESSVVGAQTGDSELHGVPEGLGAGDTMESVWDMQLSAEDIEVDEEQEVVKNDLCNFPPLTKSTPDDTGPSRADPNPKTQDSESQSGSSRGDPHPTEQRSEPTSGPSRTDPTPTIQGSEPRQDPPRNAWRRGAPSFTPSAGYTGQAFRRRNVVRFKHRGAKEDLPDRRFVVRELLCHQMGFDPGDILAVINLPDRQGYDVSFKLMSSLDRFWANFARVRDTDGWNKFIFIPISKPDTAIVNIIFWNESVPPQDIVVWLRRHCDLVSDLTKNRDDDGVWTGGWKVLVKLRQLNNVTLHLPNSFFIGREKGVCFYPGQPRKCFKCGKVGHVASVCTVVKCNLCGEIGHLSATCQNIRCNLCNQIGHSHKDCPEAYHNKCREIPDEELVERADAIEEEEALISGTVLTRHEVQQGSGETAPEHQPSENTQGSMEVVRQDQPQADSAISSSAYEEAKSKKRRKKDKSSRKSEEEHHMGQSQRKKVSNGEGVMVLSNRYDVLSESEGDYEQELQRIDNECGADTGDPPTKKKPLSIEAPVESDMETDGREEGSDSDL